MRDEEQDDTSGMKSRTMRADAKYKNIKNGPQDGRPVQKPCRMGQYKDVRNGTPDRQPGRRTRRTYSRSDVKNGVPKMERKPIRPGGIDTQNGVQAKDDKRPDFDGIDAQNSTAVTDDPRLIRYKYDYLRLKNGRDEKERPDPLPESALRAKLRKSRIRRGVTVACIVVVAVVFLRIQCGPAILFADISAYADEEILITGLLDEDFTITPFELTELDLVRDTAVGTSDKAGTVQAIGPTLETFVEAYGKDLDDFEKVKFIAEDDYTTSLVESLDEEIILSVANGRESLEDYQQPLRVVIPGVDSGTWVRMVIEIEFTAK